MNNKSSKKRQAVNEAIPFEMMQVITETGENLGIISKSEAILRAKEASLDLVHIGDSETGPVAKIMDFGRSLYEKKKKLSESKKHQKLVQIKEIKMRPNIGVGDYQTKLSQSIKFLQSGKKVKFTLQFRGREFIMMDALGTQFFEKIYKDLVEANIGTIIEEKETKGKPFWSKIFGTK